MYTKSTMDIPTVYTTTMKIIIVTAAYTYLMPFLPIIAIICLFVFYFAVKYKLLRHHSVPQPIGVMMAEDTTDYFIKMFIFMFSMGCMVFEYLLYSYSTYISVI